MATFITYNRQLLYNFWRFLRVELKWFVTFFLHLNIKILYNNKVDDLWVIKFVFTVGMYFSILII